MAVLHLLWVSALCPVSRATGSSSPTRQSYSSRRLSMEGQSEAGTSMSFTNLCSPGVFCSCSVCLYLSSPGACVLRHSSVSETPTAKAGFPRGGGEMLRHAPQKCNLCDMVRPCQAIIQNRQEGQIHPCRWALMDEWNI